MKQKQQRSSTRRIARSMRLVHLRLRCASSPPHSCAVCGGMPRSRLPPAFAAPPGVAVSLLPRLHAVALAARPLLRIGGACVRKRARANVTPTNPARRSVWASAPASLCAEYERRDQQQQRQQQEQALQTPWQRQQFELSVRDTQEQLTTEHDDNIKRQSQRPATVGATGATAIDANSNEAAAFAEKNSSSKKSAASPDAARAARGDKLLLVGLGNPGPQFEKTRHNIGFSVVTEFLERNGGGEKFRYEKRFQAEVAVARVAGRIIHVVRPRTYMNNSGAAVRAVLDYHRIPREAVLVVADDMALELGRLRLRAKGSAGGHNGLRSVEKCLGGTDYMRLKVGVGAPRGGADRWSDHVLGQFSRGDQKLVDEVLWDTMDILEEWVREADAGRIMNAYAVRKGPK